MLKLRDESVEHMKVERLNMIFLMSFSVNCVIKGKVTIQFFKAWIIYILIRSLGPLEMMY